MPDPFLIHDRAASEQFLRRQRVDPYALKRLYYALLVQGHSDEMALHAVPAQTRPLIAEGVQLHCLNLIDRFDSLHDGATKFVFRTLSGYVIETVAMKARTGRTTVCISSQAGCAANCSFCATGQMGMQAQLTAGEILDQVVVVRQWLALQGLRLRNVVFMGMGEPLHNESAVFTALEELQASDRFCFSPNRVMVSSIGVNGAAQRFAKRFPQTGFALSLHSVEQSQRETIIPLAKQIRLTQLRSLLEQMTASGRSVMIEYLMLAEVNDDLAAATSLANFLSGLHVHVNLIPYNPYAGGRYTTSPQHRRDAFALVLRQAGFLTTIRYSQGRDIAAACGQLAVKQMSSDEFRLERRTSLNSR